MSGTCSAYVAVTAEATAGGAAACISSGTAAPSVRKVSAATSSANFAPASAAAVHRHLERRTDLPHPLIAETPEALDEDCDRDTLH